MFLRSATKILSIISEMIPPSLTPNLSSEVPFVTSPISRIFHGSRKNIIHFVMLCLSFSYRFWRSVFSSSLLYSFHISMTAIASVPLFKSTSTFIATWMMIKPRWNLIFDSIWLHLLKTIQRYCLLGTITIFRRTHSGLPFRLSHFLPFSGQHLSTF